MEKRFTFNENEENYNKARPSYVNELFHDIFNYSQIGKDSRVLEIGIGTGQATIPFLNKGCEVMAVELGDRLAAYSRNKFKDYCNFSVINDDFIKIPTEVEKYDLVYSATAFHWIPEPEGYKKIMKILKQGGVVSLFWNHPFPNRLDDVTNVVNRRIYDKYRPNNKEVKEFSEKDCERQIKKLRKIGFKNVTSKVYYRVRKLSSDEYIALLNTYSDHRLLPDNIRTAFERDMKSELDKVGGFINIYDTIDLYLGRKD